MNVMTSGRAALLFALTSLALPATLNAAPADWSVDLVVTEAVGLSDSAIAKLRQAGAEALSGRALVVAHEPGAADAILRREKIDPRLCGVSPTCLGKIGRALGVRYLLVVRAARFGERATLKTTLFDVPRQWPEGESSRSLAVNARLELAVAQIVEEALPRPFRKPPATLIVTCATDGARVTLDGERIGTTPLDPIEVQGGEHLLLFEREGYREYARPFTVEPGARVSVHAELELAHRPPPPPPADLEEPAVPRKAPLQLAGWISGGASIVALGSGIGFALAKGSTERQYLDQCRVNDPTCAGVRHPPARESQDLADLRSTASTQGLISTVSFAAAGAFALTSIVLLVTSQPDDEPAPQQRRGPATELELESSLLAPLPEGGAVFALGGRF